MITNKKAQIAIEYIIFIAIFLLFFQAVVKPSIDFAENVLTDVQSVAITQESMSKLADNISAFASSMGTGRVTMNLYLPKTAKLVSCSNTEISYSVGISNVNPKPVACDHGVCNFKKDIFIGNQNINCDEIGPGFSGVIVIEKTSTGDFNVSIN
jgi:uncharacterized protein (UPF0333 family)